MIPIIKKTPTACTLNSKAVELLNPKENQFLVKRLHSEIFILPFSKVLKVENSRNIKYTVDNSKLNFTQSIINIDELIFRRSKSNRSTENVLLDVNEYEIVETLNYCDLFKNTLVIDKTNNKYPLDLEEWKKQVLHIEQLKISTIPVFRLDNITKKKDI